MSGDPGSTWSQLSMTATGAPRHSIIPVSVNRRMLILGGDAGQDFSSSPSIMNDVLIAYW